MITEQELKGHWHVLRGKLKSKWADLTDDDVGKFDGNVEQLIGRIQQRTGETRKNVEAFFDDAVRVATPPMQKAAEVVTNTVKEGYQTAEHAVREGYKKAENVARETYKSAEQATKEGYKSAENTVREGYRAAEDTVKAKPAQSMATVLGVGVALGIGIALLLRME